LSSTTDGKWKAARIIDPHISKYTKEMYKVYLDNNHIEECTADHLWLMRDGTYKRTDMLEKDDSLMPCYSKIKNGYTYIRPNNTYDYLRNLKFKNRMYVPLHRIVYETVLGDIPFNISVHHKDTSKSNNYPNNLELLDRGGHLKHHLNLRIKNGTLKFEGLVKYNKSERGRKKSREIGIKYGVNNLRKYCKTEKHKKAKCKLMSKYNKIPGIQNHLQKKKFLKYAKTLLINNIIITKESWEKYRPYGVSKLDLIVKKYYNNNFDIFLQEAEDNLISHDKLEITNGKTMIISRMVSILKKIESNNKLISEETYTIMRNKFDPTISSIINLFGSFKNFIEYYNTNNHKIIKIEKIYYEKEIPVYDVKVPIYSNFVLESGTIVHNCGLHGIGLVAINALSSYYKVEVYRNKKHGIFEFKNAKLKFKNMIDHIDHNDKVPFSTKIEFIPHKKYFETLLPDLNRVRKRLSIASAELPDNLYFVLNIDGKQEVFNLNTTNYFKSECLSGKNDDIEIIKLSSILDPERFDILFTYEKEGSVTPKILSSVNLLPVKQGGSHVIVFYDTLKEFFMNKAKKYNFRFQPNDCLYKLRAYLKLNLVEPKFSGQTKDALINTKSYLIKFVKNFKIQLERFANKNEPLLKEYLETFQSYRVNLDSKKLVKPTNGKRASTKLTKLRDCTSRNGELYITEGDSAAGGLILSRDTRKHAILPLRGKSIPNITTKKDILSNKEVGELIIASGTGVDPHFNIDDLRYDKIICATDADHDGNHIACLVTMAIGMLMPGIIKEGKYFLAQTPLFAINEGKVFIPLWNDDELEKARKDERKITRFKGLGELSPHQLKICLLDEETRNLVPMTYTDNMGDLISLFSKADEKRKLIQT